VSAQGQIQKLEALLARIQKNAAEPRPAREVAAPAAAHAHVIPSTPLEELPLVPPHPKVPEPIEAPSFELEPDVVAAAAAQEEELRRTASMFKEPLVAEGPPPIAAPPEPEILEPEFLEPEPAAQVAEPPPSPADASGEFAVAEPAAASDAEEEVEPLELEVLGEADELSDDSIVEIDMSGLEPMPAEADPTTQPLVEESGPPPRPEPERTSEPPASGRELVATPHESARLKVSAPAVPEEITLEPAHVPEPVAQIVPEPTPMVATPMPIAPVAAVPSVPPVAPAAPVIKTPPPPPLPPEQIAASVALAAEGAQAGRAIESVAVTLEAAVIRPGVTPADVAAIVGAARTFKPETFGALLDAALDL